MESQVHVIASAASDSQTLVTKSEKTRSDESEQLPTTRSPEVQLETTRKQSTSATNGEITTSKNMTVANSSSGKAGYYTVHVAIQPEDMEEPPQAKSRRRRTVPSRYKDYKYLEELVEDDEDYVPSAKVPSSGRGRGRPRKLIHNVGAVADKDTSTDTQTDTATAQDDTDDTASAQKMAPLKRGPKVKYEKFTESELLTEKRPYRCPNEDCGQTFTTESWLLRHMDTKHREGNVVDLKIKTDERKKSECPVCGRGFTQEGNMRAHMRLHTGDKRFGCDICSKNFTTAESLKRHKMAHLGIKPFECERCSAKFASNVALKEHQNRHRDLKPFQCETCQRKFRQVSVYHRHLLTHSGEHRYKCAVCDSRFTQKIYLRSHMKKHTGEKPYPCDLCGKRFAHASDKTRHQKTHSGEKPHSCDICHARFTDPSSCRRHVKEHTGDLPLTCDQCGLKFRRKVLLNAHYTRHHVGMMQQHSNMLRNNGAQQDLIIHGPGSGQSKIRMGGDGKFVVVGQSGQELPVISQVVYDENNHRVLRLVEDSAGVAGKSILVSPSGEEIVQEMVSSGSGQEVEPLSDSTQHIIHQIESQLSQDVQVAYHVLHDDDTQQIVEIQYEPMDQVAEDYVVIASGDQVASENKNKVITEMVPEAETLSQNNVIDQTQQSANQTTNDTTLIKLEDHGHQYAQPIVMATNEEVDDNEDSDSDGMHVSDQIDLAKAEILPVDSQTLEAQMQVELPLTTSSVIGTEYSLFSASEAPSVIEVVPDMKQSGLASVGISTDLEPSQYISTSEITKIYVNQPDFNSQEYYNWLSMFTDYSKQAAVPLDELTFKNISQLHKTLTDIMAKPSGILANKENFKILMSISHDLNAIISKHLMCVLQTLDKPDIYLS